MVQTPITLNDLEPQNKGFSEFFSRFQTAIHILRVNCAETIQDRPGQPAYDMFGIKRRFQRCEVRPPRFKESSVRALKFGYPLQNVRFLLLSSNLARELLQIDTDFLRIIISNADELSGGGKHRHQHRWPWTTLNRKIGGFSEFLAILGCDAHLSEYSLKLLEIDQDNLRTKLNWCCRASHDH